MKLFFKKYSDIVFFSCSLLLIEVLFRLYVGFDVAKQPFVFDFAYIVLFCALLILIKPKPRKIIEIIFIVIISIYAFAQEIHNNFFSSFFRVSKINIIGELPQIANEVLSKIDIKSFLVFLPLLLFVICAFVFKNNDDTYNLKSRFIISIIAIVFFIFSMFMLNRKLQNEVVYDGINEWINDLRLRESLSSGKRYCDRFGVLDYVVNDIKHEFINDNNVEFSKEDLEEIDNYIKEENKTITDNDYTGIYKDKNLILILAESLNNYPIDEEITPTLYKMATEGIYFDNYYAPLFQGSTSDSEFISQTSMIPSMSNGVTCYTYGSNTFTYGLANLFKNNGYHTDSFHSSFASYYNRELLHVSFGFDKFYGIEELGIEYPPFFQNGQNWIEDSILFNYSLEKTDTTSKFYDFIISASGHMPYVYRDENDYNLNELNANSRFASLADETKNYLACQMNFDKGLKQLLDDLSSKGVLEDTIIVIYGDHYPYGISQEKAIKEVLGDNEYPYEKYRVPFIIYDPSGNTNHQINSKLSCTFDIYPTICNLFDLDYKNAFVAGRDLFDKTKHVVPFMDGSILTEDFYYNAEEGNIVSFNEETSDYAKVIEDVKKLFTIGSKVLISDYYAH